MFQYFLSDDIKQDSATTTSHRKRFIELLKERKLLASSLSKIWENTDSCAEQYICAYEIYFMSVMFQCYSVIIDHGMSAPGYGKEVIDDLNEIDNLYIYKLRSNSQVTVSKNLIHRF